MTFLDGPRYYVLDANRQIRGTDDVMEWGRWMETQDRHVAETRNEHIRVSTVFLGLDHRYWGKGPPLLFETMIFGGAHDQEQWRYSSWDDAEIGHAMAVKLAWQRTKA